MLKIVDNNNKVKYILRDEDEEPLSVDELILNDEKNKDEGEENKDASTK